MLLFLLACGSPPPPPQTEPAADVTLDRVTPPSPSIPAVDIQADLHLDTPTQLLRRKVGLEAPGLEAGLPQLRAGGTNLAVMVLWPPREADWEGTVQRLIASVEAEDQRLEGLLRVGEPAEARRAAAEGKVGYFYSLEGAHGIDRSGVAGLEALHGKGLRMLGLTWSFSNRFAGSSADGGGGLTEAGRELVVAANRLNILLDLSHASRATTLETCALSTDPVLASHSDAAAIQPNARNLSDEELRCICDGGGVVGLNFHAPFVGKGASLARVAEHAAHIRAVGGAGCVALGSDFDGLIHVPPELPDASALPALWAELQRQGWTKDELQGLRGGNFMRLWGKVRQ
ncbi:MAG TPA: membrane dipeptidase [Myxococcota bacterium]|nr:membrane dipeptidase [Myxococcota bacterium]